MVRSLKFIALITAVVVGSTMAFTARSVSPRSSTAVWGVQRNTVSMSPAVIEKETVKTGPAVLERPNEKVEDPVKEQKRTGGEAWEVRIYNDGLNTREHVARSLVQVTGMSEVSAYQTMMQAHQNGIAVVGRWCYEVAEMYHDALRKNGIVCDLVPVDEDH